MLKCKYVALIILMVKCSVWFLGLLAFSLHYSEHEALPLSSSFEFEPRPLARSEERTDSQEHTKDAYVTLLYGGFLLGARVLGQSLRETDTKKDLVALCTETVSEDTKRILKADGWIIKSIGNIQSPYEGLSSRGDYFSGIFSKLHIWNMTDYDRIIYLDSDVLVLSNIDHMFDCGTFCAAYRHSDLFNAGVLVVQPSRAIFKDMLEQIPNLLSYDDGDQGFLNVYWKDLVYASMFNWSNMSRQRQPMRMPAGLNADIGSYYANSHWNIPKDQIRVVHYTLGPVKPWIWWSNFLFDLNWQWTRVRSRLPQNNHHTDTFKPLYLPFFWFPYLFLMFFCISAKLFDCYYPRWFSSKNSASALKIFGTVHEKFSHIFPLMFLLCSYYLTFKVVIPTTMIPCQAEYVFWLWSNCFLLVFLGIYCYLCYVTGKLRDNHYHSFPRRKLQTFTLYVVFVVSYIVLKVATPTIEPFSRRVMFFFLLITIHVVVSHVTGSWLFRLWTGYKIIYYTADDAESCVSSLSLKKMCL